MAKPRMVNWTMGMKSAKNRVVRSRRIWSISFRAIERIRPRSRRAIPLIGRTPHALRLGLSPRAGERHEDVFQARFGGKDSNALAFQVDTQLGRRYVPIDDRPHG